MTTGLDIKTGLRKEIGRELKLFRKQKRLSQIVLAKQMGVSRSTLSKIENGKFSISIDYLEKFSVHLGFKVKLLKN